MTDGDKLTLICWPTQEAVRERIQECEGKHPQQVVYSTFHDALTQVCYGCGVVRTTMPFHRGGQVGAGA